MLSRAFLCVSRRVVSLAGAIAMASTVACTDQSTAPMPASALDAPSLGKNVVVAPIVDGKITPGEYDGAAKVDFRVMLPTTEGAQPATVYITHDKQYLYLAATFDRKWPFHTADRVGFEFDNDNDGIREDGDDIIMGGAYANQNTQYLGADFYRFNNGASNQSDPVIDVTSAFGAVGTQGVFEIRHDLNSADNAHDFSIDPSIAPVTVGMLIQVSLEANPVGSGVFVHTFKPSANTYCTLTIAKKSTSVSCP